MSNKKQRLDILMVERGLAETRNKARQLIEGGFVEASCGGKLSKPGQNVPDDIELTITQKEQWVSRAALKLDFALSHWNIRANNKTCMDIGASTGGFCEVLLKNGVKKVYAIDVGHGQMHHSIASDPKIISLEKTNCKDLTTKEIPEDIELFVCDVSFISLEKALPVPLTFAKKNAELVALIKPQFEVGKQHIGDGVVKDEKLHKQVVEKIKDWLAEQNWLVCGTAPSPIEGGSGNKEFLVYAKYKTA